MAKLFFSKEERLLIENNVLKENNLSMQITMLQSERQNLIADFCKRNSKKTEEVVGINVAEGFVEFKDGKEIKTSTNKKVRPATDPD